MANTNKAQKRKKAIRRAIAIVAVVLVILLAAVLYVRKSVQQSVNNKNGSSIQSAQVSTGSIRTTVSGSGMLTSEDVQELSVPAPVKVEEMYVEQGDPVEEGMLLARVNTSTVLTTLATVQDALDELDDDIHDASNDTVSSAIKAGVSGRIKEIYAAKGDNVASVMYEHGALALISMDGYMAVDIPAGSYAKGDEVTVQDEEGNTWEGTVDYVTAETATVLITDDGPVNGSKVSVDAGATGELYIHSPLKVTGYAGTVNTVNARENNRVYANSHLFALTDTSDSAKYDQLLEDRAEYEELYQKLVKLYKDGGLVAERAGTVQSAVDTDTLSLGSDPLQETVLVSLDPDETVSVTISVDETDILSLEVGQEVSVGVESIGDDSYTGTVSEIDTLGSSGIYSVKVTLPKASGMLSGMTADVDVTIQGVENALLIPADAIRKTSATAYVYTAYDAETDTLGGMVEVTTGLTNGTYTEITSGLQEGDTVYYSPKEQTFSFGGFTFTTSGNMGGMSMPSGGNMSGRGDMGSNRGGNRGGDMGSAPGGSPMG